MEYLEHLWGAGESRSAANYTLAAVQHPLNVRNRFVGTWPLISAWQRLEHLVRTPPLPVWRAGLCSAGGLTSLLAFWWVSLGFMREGEVLSLTRDLIISDGPQSAMLVLPHAKMTDRRGA